MIVHLLSTRFPIDMLDESQENAVFNKTTNM